MDVESAVVVMRECGGERESCEGQRRTEEIWESRGSWVPAGG